MRLKYLLWLPLVAFLVLGAMLAIGLWVGKTQLPSPLLNKPLPYFDVPTVSRSPHHLQSSKLTGQVSLVHFWASWCGVCRREHPVLMDIASKHQVLLYGINYKDDMESAKAWLHRYGDPYVMSGVDRVGRLGINFGVYGTPETFLVDKQGVIRYKHVGAISRERWGKEILPLVKQLQAETIDRVSITS